MARKVGAEAIYEVAQSFRDRCIKSDQSLLWPGNRPWTAENMRRLWIAFKDNPDVSEQTFYQKWKGQLANEAKDVHRIATDLVAFYYLFPQDIKKDTKLERLKTVISWKLSSEQPNLASVERAFDSSIGTTGRVYLNRIPDQIAFFLAFAEAVHAGKANSDDVNSYKLLADEVSKGIKTSKAGRNVLLHLLFPDDFEGTVSLGQKENIIKAFREFAGDSEDLDDELLNIRHALAQKYGDPKFDFYRPDIRKLWDKEPKTGLACWVEKTIVRGRPDREQGEYAVGRALWSPAASRGGADIYQSIRNLNSEDIVLHLTDNSAFTRISRVSAPYEEFNGVPNTEWGVGRSYLVKLGDCVDLVPPLTRETFFSPPYRERLISVLDQGAKNLFYNHELNLNQGAYLTPAPAELVSALNDAYEESAGKSLADVVPDLKKIIETVGSRNAWIFQANPARYDVRRAIRTLKQQSWSVNRFKDKMKIGDIVYLWESGHEGGIVGVAEIAELPKMGTSPEEEIPFSKILDDFEGEYVRTILNNLKIVEPPISRQELLEHRELTGMSLFRQPQGTNFRLTEEEARVLGAIVGGTEVSSLQPVTSLGELEEFTNLTAEELHEIESLLQVKGQLILEGPPGVGKTYVAQLFARYFTKNPLDDSPAENTEIVQFHQSYSYEDFIQGIRPETNPSGQLEYHVRPGIFKTFCDYARKSNKPYVFIIDEINRGNISRIFGELLFLLEYRVKDIPLPYDQSRFSIPMNVYLIGTMNTTDRSLAQIDYALRRRFYFYRLQPITGGRAPVLEKQLQKLGVPLEARERVVRLFIMLNNRVQERLGENFQIGHSYFMLPNIGQGDVLQQVWNRSISPLLEEYFYNSRDRASILSEFTINNLLSEKAVPPEVA